MLTKAPVAGRVKTRLAKTIGEEAALRVHRSMAEHTLAQARIAAAAGHPLVVFVDPADAVDEVRRWLGVDLDVRPQADGSLGARMRRAFDVAFAEGVRRVVLVGTDCPRLEARHLLEGFELLENSDVVLGPAHDGGYWLIGARDRTPPLFEGVVWSGDDVLATTERLAAGAGLRVAHLETLDDVDTADDLARYPDLLA